MKKIAAGLIAAIIMVSFASPGFAAESKKGTIRAVDTKAGTITFCPEGTETDMVLKAGKDVDLSKIKPDTRAEVTIEKDTVTNIKDLKQRKPAVGC